MTEHNIFCFSKKYEDEDSFQQKRWRAFNKEVGEKRYREIEKEVCNILGNPKLKLVDFWKQVTQEQWQRLLDIPEAKDFKEGFEYISGVNIDVKNDCDGEIVEIKGKKYKLIKINNHE